MCILATPSTSDPKQIIFIFILLMFPLGRAGKREEKRQLCQTWLGIIAQLEGTFGHGALKSGVCYHFHPWNSGKDYRVPSQNLMGKTQFSSSEIPSFFPTHDSPWSLVFCCTLLKWENRNSYSVVQSWIHLRWLIPEHFPKEKSTGSTVFTTTQLPA